jgi:polyphenol oxidase
MSTEIASFQELKPAGPLVFVQYPNILVRHATTTRIGGVSQAPFDSLNVGTTSPDDQSHVAQNRALVSQHLGMKVIPRLSMNHGNRVQVFREIPQDSSPRPTADACITDTPGLSLSITTADCVPILFYCPNGKQARPVVGLAHAGWRGTVSSIGAETVRAMIDEYGCRLEEIQAAVGPCIQSCCFEVDQSVADQFSQRFSEPRLIRQRPPAAEGEPKYDVDLVRANELVLLEAGLPSSNIAVSRLCSSCRSDLFFSHRRDKGRTGRMLSLIQSDLPPL